MKLIQDKKFLWLGIVLIITGVRLIFLEKYGDSYPYYDSWLTDGQIIFPKVDQGVLGINDLIEPYNEHRILWSRLANIIFYKTTGVWDNYHQVCASNLLVGFGTVIGLNVIWHKKNKISLAELFFAIVPSITIGAFENAILGFQTPFFFLYLFMNLVLASVFSENLRWCDAVWLFLVAVSVLFTLGSGIGIVVGGLVIIALLRFYNKIDTQHLLQKIVPLLAAFFVACLLFTGRVKGDLMGGAETVRDFILALSKNLAWPWCLEATGFLAPLTAAFLWLPVVVLFFMWIVGGRVGEKRTLWAIGLGIMVFIQAAGIAWGRGLGGVPPQVRYLDLLSWGFWAQGLAWIVILEKHTAKWIKCIGVIWAVVAFSGIIHLQAVAWSKGGPDMRARLQEQRVVVAEYINSNYDPNLVIIAGGYLRMLKNFSTPISPEAVRWAYEKRVLPEGEFGEPATQGRGAWLVKMMLDGAWWIAGLGAALVYLGWRNRLVSQPSGARKLET